MTLSSALHVSDQGSGDPVLLLHSSGLSGRQWSRTAAALASAGMRAVVPDLSGHGSSEAWPEPKPFSFETDVARVVELLGQLGSAHVVGHSYGGFLALQGSLRAPANVRSLCLYDPVAFGVLDRDADADAMRILFDADFAWGPTAEDRERWLAAFVEFWNGPKAWEGLRDAAREEFRRVAWIVREGVRTLGADRTSASVYGAMGLPVQLLTGALSPLPARRVIQRLAEHMPGARVATVDGAGHLGPLTHEKVVTAILLEALGAMRRPRG